MIKAIVFDCFGVFINDALLFKIRQYAAIDPEGGRQLHTIVQAINRGMLTRGESIEQMANIMKVDPVELLTSLNDSVAKNDALIDYVRTLKGQYKLAMLSNVRGRARLDELFGTGVLDELFEVVVASGDVGSIKPEPEIYNLTLRKLGVAANESIMIDDLPSYCEGARAVGMHVVQFIDNAQCQRDVAALIDTEGQTD
ncbi:MAG: HAD-IA family hydrolase [Candidatus Microsaccharimonas sp.]